MSLYIVATPIGNLEDISARALKILASVDLIAAEDTRHSRTLLAHYSIQTELVAYHDHNEMVAASRLLEKILAGQDVALISDAGTPLISDPGYRLVKYAWQSGIEVIPVPGPSAFLAALSISGLPTDKFRFEGFLPAKSGARQSRLEALKQESCTLIFYEAPHRIDKMLEDLVQVFGGDRLATIAREMTKKFEQISHGELNDLSNRIKSGEIVARGEFVVMVIGSKLTMSNFEEIRLMTTLLEELPPGKAADIAHKLTGAGKKYFYDLSLKLKPDK